MTKGIRPDPVHVAAVHDTARAAHRARPRGASRSTRTTPTRRSRSCRSSSPGIRTEADAVEHYDRLERRTRETYRMGTWVRPGVRRLGAAPDREGLREGQPGLRRLRRAAHPDDGAPAARGRHPRRRRHGRAPRCARCRRSRTPRCGTSPATRPPRCRAGSAADGLPTRGAAGRPHRRRGDPALAVASSRRPGPGRCWRVTPRRPDTDLGRGFEPVGHRRDWWTAHGRGPVRSIVGRVARQVR